MKIKLSSHDLNKAYFIDCYWIGSQICSRYRRRSLGSTADILPTMLDIEIFQKQCYPCFSVIRGSQRG